MSATQLGCRSGLESRFCFRGKSDTADFRDPAHPHCRLLPKALFVGRDSINRRGLGREIQRGVAHCNSRRFTFEFTPGRAVPWHVASNSLSTKTVFPLATASAFQTAEELDSIGRYRAPCHLWCLANHQPTRACAGSGGRVFAIRMRRTHRRGLRIRVGSRIVGSKTGG